MGHYNEFPIPPVKTASKEFMALGNCHGMDPDLFYPERGDTRKLHEAKRVCTGCTVKAECLEYALTPPLEKWGIWGGISERERRTIRNNLEIRNKSVARRSA